MLKLYYSPGACSLTAHIALEEIGIPYEKELIRAGSGDGTGSERWRKINPRALYRPCWVCRARWAEPRIS